VRLPGAGELARAEVDRLLFDHRAPGFEMAGRVAAISEHGFHAGSRDDSTRGPALSEGVNAEKSITITSTSTITKQDIAT
jgi:hypothetical protein